MGRKVQQRHAGRSALQQVSLEIRVPEEQLGAAGGRWRAMARASSAEAGSGLLSSAPPSSIACALRRQLDRGAANETSWRFQGGAQKREGGGIAQQDRGGG